MSMKTLKLDFINAKSYIMWLDKNLQKSGATFSLCRVESFYYREIRSSMVRTYQ